MNSTANEFWRLLRQPRPKARGHAATRAELTIFGDIGEDWDGPESLSAQRLVEALADISSDTEEITVRLNSYGGRVSDGLAIYNALRRHPAGITVSVEGVAVSIASLIAMAGDRIEMAENALMMIHAPWAMAIGNSRDMRTAAETLDTYAEAMASSYARASGKSRNEVMALLTDGEDHWYTADQAVAEGFAHEITEPLAAAASMRLPDRFRAQDTNRQRTPNMKQARTANMPTAGSRLASTLNDAIDAIDDDRDDERSREDVIDEMATSADINRDTVNRILEAAINCPPQDHFAAFARVNGMPGEADQRAAAEADGCEYDENGQARACPRNGDSYMSGNVSAAMLKQRNDEIRMAFRPFAADAQVRELEADCLADPAITAEQARAKLLDKMGEGAEPVNPPGYSPFASGNSTPGSNSHHAEFRDGLADAILMRYGVPVAKPHPAAADLRHMSSIDICRTILSQSGRRPRSESRADIVQGAMTTSDLPALLENIAHKSAMIGFEETEAASHRTWVRQGELDDFKESLRVALSEAPGLEKVDEGGEYKHGGMLDAGERIRADTYGRIIGLTRQAMINDDLGELARIPNALGQAAARKEADLVYSLLIENPSMRDETPLFHTDHGNVASPAAPSVDSLGEARKLMRVQKGLKGEATLNLSPRYLIVPAALETAAERLLAEIQPTKSADATPDWIRRLEVVVDSRLDLDSEIAWYLAAAPNQFDTVEVARLGGQGAQVLSEEGFDTDTMRFKVRLEVGAAVLDWRGLVRNEGT